MAWGDDVWFAPAEKEWQAGQFYKLRARYSEHEKYGPQIELIPTGGVSLETAAGFIAAGAFALGVGADLVDLAALRRGDHASVTGKARQYVAAILGECG